jgi:hypothetical protein
VLSVEPLRVNAHELREIPDGVQRHRFNVLAVATPDSNTRRGKRGFEEFVGAILPRLSLPVSIRAV